LPPMRGCRKGMRILLTMFGVPHGVETGTVPGEVATGKLCVL
jgi:hypothetical protein